jgi:hypothetical protein
MKKHLLRSQLAAIFLVFSIGACGDKSPTAPVNHNPVISSVLLFPRTIGPADSAIVVCNATDPDGDSLVYDWETSADLRIKGAPYTVYLFNTTSNSRIFYYNTPPTPTDTAMIWCHVRDLKGGVDGRLLLLPLHP